MSQGQLWTNQGSYLASPKLSKDLAFSAQPMFRFRQFVDAKNALGKSEGDTFNWDKVANVSDFGGQIAETSTMHETTQGITKGTLTVTEYGNSIPYTGKIETLSFTDIKRIIDKGLRHDMVKCMDGEVERQFNATPLRYVGTTTAGGALTTNGTATATNTSAFNLYHSSRMRDALLSRNTPGLDGTVGKYMCIASIEAMRGIANDLKAINVHQVAEGYAKLVKGGQFEWDNVVYVLDTFATRYTYSSTARTATAKSWTTGNSLDAYMFGEDTVTEAVVVPEEIRAKIPTDYGRSKGIAWYFLGGWKIDWDTAADARIIKWDSAA